MDVECRVVRSLFVNVMATIHVISHLWPTAWHYWQFGVCCEVAAAAMGSAGWIMAVLSQLSWAGAGWPDPLMDASGTCSSNQGQTSVEPGLSFFATVFILITAGFTVGYVCSGLRRRPSRREVSTQTPCRYSWKAQQPRFTPVPEGVDGAWPHELLG